uniref:Uncharacterized protein n=1 Tax=Paracidobacterium acidisoli TaxID=2303751 RepID=A0A372INJ9_9BACT
MADSGGAVADDGAVEELTQTEGAFELAPDQKALTAAVIGMEEPRKGALIVSGTGLETADGVFEGEPKAAADVDGLGGRSFLKIVAHGLCTSFR